MKIVLIASLIVCSFLITWAQTTPQKIEATASSAIDERKLAVEAAQLFNAGKYKEALPIALQVLEIRTRDKGLEHLETGQALRILGIIQQAAGDNKSAEKSIEKALAIYSVSGTLTESQIAEKAEMLEMQGIFKYKDQKYGKAAEFFEIAVSEREKAKGANELELASSLWSLANLRYILRDYKKSEPLFKRVLEIHAKKLKPDNPLIFDSRNRYVCNASKNNNAAEAKIFLDSLFPRAEEDSKTPKQINGGVMNGKALYLPKPQYPADARAQRAKGAIPVMVTINEAGKVIFACASEGNKLLWETAENAAYGALFSPTSLKGQLVKVSGIITYNFVP